ncbi:uncharacterized protein LOC105698351 [Orussus abietinus]|uniref:uncharacterized protein LOC105698351 n=1 Tax=Orussus abietinus TaxID=222816 RepID=UPI0006264EBC|nr:uncharacterized protein LOC105698351 [Orussus abietinus]
MPYTAANSHPNTFRESNSHGCYSLRSEISERKFETFCDSESSYSMANSHGAYKISDRTLVDGENRSCERLVPPEAETNYEIANSHSNYRIFYNSQTRYDRDIITTKDNFINISRSENDNGFQSTVGSDFKSTVTSFTRSNSSHSSKSTEESITTCDIEECLIQIEESLLNIEQNLLHVQDLNIPEIKKLLHTKPSIERSLSGVHDLIYTDNIGSAKRHDALSLASEDGTGNMVDATSKRDLQSPDRNAFANNDNFFEFMNDRSVGDLVDVSSSVPDVLNSIIREGTDKSVNFIPNSLGKTPLRSTIDGTKDNIRVGFLNCTDSRNVCDENRRIDSMNYNFNHCLEAKKLLNQKKCHNRCNSLDKNSIFQNSDSTDQRIASLENLFSESIENLLSATSKARSEDTLEHCNDEISLNKNSMTSGRKAKENRLAKVEAKADEFRKKIRNIISNRRSVLPQTLKKITKNSKDLLKNRENSQDRLPNTNNASTERLQDMKYVSPNNKPLSNEKKKRKKIINRTSSSENALVPSKLISLSLSLLLAALLQAVRCLTDLVEDAFRSVNYDRSGLLE